MCHNIPNDINPFDSQSLTLDRRSPLKKCVPNAFRELAMYLKLEIYSKKLKPINLYFITPELTSSVISRNA